MAATLIIHRAVPFTRGDQTIRIWIDGKDVGMLPAHEPFVRELATGPHTLQAWMNGGTGKKVTIDPAEGSTVRLRLSGTQVPASSWWDWII